MRSNLRTATPALVVLLASGLLLVSSALAEEAPAADGSGDRATSFQAVEGAVKEDVPGGPLLLAAYGFVWLAVLGYVLRLGRLSARADESLQVLERAVEKAGVARSEDPSRTPGG